MKYKSYKKSYQKKVTVFKKYLLLKKFKWKSSSSEEASASKKYMLWIITYSGEKVPPKR